MAQPREMRTLAVWSLVTTRRVTGSKSQYPHWLFVFETRWLTSHNIHIVDFESKMMQLDRLSGAKVIHFSSCSNKFLRSMSWLSGFHSACPSFP
jgi:hypothetical protein